MAISKEVRDQLFEEATEGTTMGPQAIRIPVTRDGGKFMQHPDVERFGGNNSNPGSARGIWTVQEHQRFLDALDMFPSGPWKRIAEYVGTKTPRQAMTHGQKYRQKIARRRRGLKKVVRDLQFTTPQESEQIQADLGNDAAGRLSIESNPTGLSQEELAEFIAGLDLAQELDQDVNPAAEDDESPLIVPDVVSPSDMASFYLSAPANAEPGLEAMPAACAELLSPMTTEQDVHHWVAMTRADASSEEFSAALVSAFQSNETGAFARPMVWSDKLTVFCQLGPQDATAGIAMEPLQFSPTLSHRDDMDLDGLEL